METPELIAALCKAQAAFTPAIKDAANPFFKSKYADLSAVWEACKQPLAENGLFISQQPQLLEGVDVLRTRVYHTSGGFIESNMKVVVTKGNDPQAFGSAMTYTRRYSLAAILGIVTDDDDAEGAMARGNQNSKPQAQKREQAQPQAEAQALAKEPITSEQKGQIIKLLTHPMVQQEDKKKVLDNLGKISSTKAVSMIENLTQQQNAWEQSNKQQLHDLVTENSETIGDDLVEHYLKIVETGKVAEIRDTLDKVTYLLKNKEAA